MNNGGFINTSNVVETVNVNINKFTGELMSEINLGDIPDLSNIDSSRPEPLADGWYQGVILEKREFTDSNGNDRVFESSDSPAQKSGRNIRLQVELTRRGDSKKFNLSTLINYNPADLTAETVAAVAQRAKENKEGAEWGDLFRPFMTLTRLGKLQKIAGVRQLQRNGDGGLDLTALFGKTAYFRVKPDSRNPQYKEVADFQDYEPKRVPVL
jgi:hypothetical protein